MCPFYVEGKGRPSIPSGTYFRMHLAGYFEGLESERLICWRVSDSLALRPFLGYDLTQSTPDHSTPVSHPPTVAGRGAPGDLHLDPAGAVQGQLAER